MKSGLVPLENDAESSVGGIDGTAATNVADFVVVGAAELLLPLVLLDESGVVDPLLFELPPHAATADVIASAAAPSIIARLIAPRRVFRPVVMNLSYTS